ncbi:putative transposase [uncultured Thiodictyon sp.]|uniref:putative transposase n=1 Tax=uncultured Thiodictyon sp. TaxID=1846217 RepID=UPI0025FF8DA0|nr:hypothetical protein [uncultured Thiodictyon sp.]
MADYRTEAISEPLQVVNPDYRHLDGQVRAATGKLNRRLAQFAARTLDEPIEPKHVEPFIRRKAALQEEIEARQGELAVLKAQRKETPHHIRIDELPEEARFRQFSTQGKQLVDTIKMIAYRAETAMANCLREHLTRPDEARYTRLQAIAVAAINAHKVAKKAGVPDRERFAAFFEEFILIGTLMLLVAPIPLSAAGVPVGVAVVAVLLGLVLANSQKRL